MSDTVLVAILGLAGSLLGSLFGILASSKLTNYRLEQLEKKVQAHNTLIERTYKLEENEKVFATKMEILNEKVEYLNKKGA